MQTQGGRPLGKAFVAFWGVYKYPVDGVETIGLGVASPVDCKLPGIGIISGSATAVGGALLAPPSPSLGGLPPVFEPAPVFPGTRPTLVAVANLSRDALARSAYRSARLEAARLAERVRELDAEVRRLRDQVAELSGKPWRQDGASGN